VYEDHIGRAWNGQEVQLTCKWENSGKANHRHDHMATDFLQHVPSEAFPYLSTTYIVVLVAPGTNFIQHILEQIGRENVNRTQTLLRFAHRECTARAGDTSTYNHSPLKYWVDFNIWPGNNDSSLENILDQTPEIKSPSSLVPQASL
jgi:hypothetical protein